MTGNYITGIQQVGIGVTDAHEAARLYKGLFHMNALVFDDTSDASLMTQYTGNEVFRRRALLTLNMQGGGGFEIWQFLNRKPEVAKTKASYGDLGIFATILKCSDAGIAHQFLSKQSGIILSPVYRGLQEGQPYFWVEDSDGNTFQIKQYGEQFNGLVCPTGGVLGAIIGVSDMEKALALYCDTLGINKVISDVTNHFKDNKENSPVNCRRVLLQKKPDGRGAFGKLLGSVQIELVQVLNKPTLKTYENRFWGDPGFIHLCFDVLDMEGLKAQAEAAGFPFTVDSQESFPMEKAAGRFCYLEDADGTLIELVETHKVPILKKLNLYLNLKKRGLEKPLPDWMVKLLGLSKVK